MIFVNHIPSICGATELSLFDYVFVYQKKFKSYCCTMKSVFVVFFCD